MKNKASKAQAEVWKWKEKSYEEIKDLSSLEQIKFIKKETMNLADKINKAKMIHFH